MLPKCKKCKETLHFAGYASMGGSHSNYYRCPECKRVVEIYDRDLPEQIQTTKVVGKQYF